MNVNKISIYTTFDSVFNTWNVMDMDNHCLFFGSIDALEKWLDENSDMYVEEKYNDEFKN